MDVSASRYDDVPLIGSGNKPWMPYRYKLVLLTFFGFFNAFAVRFNFNIALVAMVNFTDPNPLNTSDECPLSDAGNSSVPAQQGEFSWDSDVQGQLLAAFFYGYIFTQLPGGYLAEIGGAKRVLGFTVLLPGMLTLLTPVVARWRHVNCLLALRVCMGVAQGALYPANHALWGQWAPSLERSQLTTWASAGGVLGVIVTQTLTGYLCSLSFMGGWPITFYIFGTCSVLWFIVWMKFAFDSPKNHPNLSQHEKLYIEQHNSAARHAQDTKSLNRPWAAIFTSVPVWAIIIFSLLDGIGYYILQSGVPIYLKQILRYDITADGFLSSVPYVGNFVCCLLAGPLADWIRRKKYLTTGGTRKLLAFIGEGLIAGFLVGMAFVACDRILAVVMVVLAFTVYGISAASQPVNHLDIAPAYAGTLMGISNVFANVGGFLSPILVSKMTLDQPVRSYWQHTFYLAAGIYALAMISWMLFSSGEEQAWAKKSSRSTRPINRSTEEEGASSVEDADVDFISGPWAGLHARSYSDNPNVDVF